MVVISVLSGKGGVGKTTVTSNLATALANQFGRKVIVLDTNVSSSHIRLHFGMIDSLGKTLPDVIKGRTVLDKATYKNEVTGVDIVPSSAGLNRNLDLDKLKAVAADIADSEYDFTIVDASPGFGPDVDNAIKAADKVLVVTNPNIPSVNDALKTVELARKAKKKVAIVLNRSAGKKYEMDNKSIEDMLDAEIDAVIPEDEKVPESILRGAPVVVYAKGSKAAIAFKKLAADLTNQTYRPSAVDRLKWMLGM